MKFTKRTAGTSLIEDVTLYQDLDSTLGILRTDANLKALCIMNHEVLSRADVKKIEEMMENPTYGSYVKALLDGSEEDKFEIITPVIEFLNNKRAFGFEIDGVQRMVVIPSVRIKTEGMLDSFAKQLFNVAREYLRALNSDQNFNNFCRRVQYLQENIAKRILTKNFKSKFQFEFKGLSGVVLTGNLSYDGVAIPQWYAKKLGINIGDLVVITRDPIQNIFLTLKVEAFTANEIRVNSHTITWVDGDFDGDRMQVIPFCNIMKECDEFGVTEEAKASIVSELTELLPSSLVNNEKFARLIRDYSL
ncbi:MAG: hypothetical protein ACRCYT_04790 [Cetobacterium sp.]